MNLIEYYDALESADWFYHMSDDPRVYHSGERHFSRLEAEARTDLKKAALFAAFKMHHYSGEAFGRPKSPKPERPIDPPITHPACKPVEIPAEKVLEPKELNEQ
jgi:hypothetical protein